MIRGPSNHPARSAAAESAEGDGEPDRALRESERRWSLLVRLGDMTRDLAEPRDLVSAALEVLREHLGADRCAWAEVEEDEDHFTFVGDAVAAGVPHVEGRFPVSAFGASALRALRAGQPFQCDDAGSAPLEAAERAGYLATGIQALIAVPIHKGGRLVAGTGVHMLSPRRWTPEEVESVQQVTARCAESIERARVQQALRDSEERYRAVVESQSEMLCRFHRDGTISFVNSAYARSLRLTPKELVGRNLWDFVSPEDQAAVRGHLERLTPEAPEVSIENRFTTAQGERWTLWSNRALTFDGEGRVLEAQSSGIDITERKRMEEALRAADRRKDEFLAMLAHELRNPLAPILTATQVLKLSGGTDARQRWAQEVIERQVQHLTRLVDDLLDVSRITHGKFTLSHEPLEVATIIRRAVEASRPIIDARRHQLTITLPVEAMRVDGDLTRLVQVVGNLLNNAAKYTDEGGHLWLEARRDGDEAIIRVRDSGMGISAELLPHVFDLFAQADRSLDRAQGGLGIGLTLVRRLVEAHGGRVEAASRGAGQGSEFTIRLPAADARASAASLGPLPEPAGGRGGLRLLVVEDNIDAAETMAVMLTCGGHDVQVVHDGLEALGAARAFRPHVVLCDIGLPRLNGYDVAARLRAEATLHQVCLIAISGYGQEADRLRARDAGFDHHFTKPVEPAILEALLASLSAELKAPP